jgi:3-oxoadipate enol-lactonase
MPYAVNGGVKTYYEVSGDGPALVLIPANPCDHTMFLYQIAHFSTWFKVIALDTRAYGRSDKVRTPYKLIDLTNDVVAICKAEKIDKAIFCGVSVGARIAMQLAIDYPDLCRAIILGGGTAGEHLRQQHRGDGYRNDLNTYRKFHLEQIVAQTFPKTPIGRYLIDMFLDTNPWLDGEAIPQVFIAQGAIDLRPMLPGIKTPTLVINGEFDNSLPGGTETAGLIPGAQHCILKGAGHPANFEDPAGFDDAVIEFLKAKGLMPKA